MVDIKFYSNLDGRDWNDPAKYLANAGIGQDKVTYKMQPGEYGVFTDPYNVGHGHKNAESQYVPDQVTLTYPSTAPVVAYVPVKGIDTANQMVPSKSTSCRPIQE